MRWFFDETWFSDEECDYAITATNTRRRRATGYTDGPQGPAKLPDPGGEDDEGPYDAEVVVERLGGVRLPVAIRVDLADGRSVRESWDGRYRWARFRYPGARVVAAAVDPDRLIALDVDPSNNGWVEEKGQARRAAAKWAARWMFWLQNLLELHAVIG
jgi:hypothetical protein